MKPSSPPGSGPAVDDRLPGAIGAQLRHGFVQRFAQRSRSSLPPAAVRERGGRPGDLPKALRGQHGLDLHIERGRVGLATHQARKAFVVVGCDDKPGARHLLGDEAGERSGLRRDDRLALAATAEVRWRGRQARTNNAPPDINSAEPKSIVIPALRIGWPRGKMAAAGPSSSVRCICSNGHRHELQVRPALRAAFPRPGPWPVRRTSACGALRQMAGKPWSCARRRVCAHAPAHAKHSPSNQAPSTRGEMAMAGSPFI